MYDIALCGGVEGKDGEDIQIIDCTSDRMQISLYLFESIY